MANLLDLMKKNEDGSFNLRLDKGIIALFIGRSGSGKSAAALSFPRPIYTFDIDNRIRGALVARHWLGIEEMKKVDFDFYNPRDGFKVIDDKLETFLNQARSHTLPYKTIIVDSMGSLIYMLAITSKRLRGEKGKVGKIRGGLMFLQPDDYNFVYMAMRSLMYEFVMPLAELGINFISSAWLLDKWGKKAGADEYAPQEIIGEKMLGPAQIAEEIPGYFDEVYRFHKEGSAIKGGQEKYLVQFKGAFAKTALDLPAGAHEITTRSFYDQWKTLIEKNSEKELTKNDSVVA